MEIILDKVDAICKKYGKVETYIIHNEQNAKKLESLVTKKYPKLSVKLLYQLLRPVVNLSGKLCICDQKGY